MNYTPAALQNGLSNPNRRAWPEPLQAALSCAAWRGRLRAHAFIKLTVLVVLTALTTWSWPGWGATATASHNAATVRVAPTTGPSAQAVTLTVNIASMTTNVPAGKVGPIVAIGGLTSFALLVQFDTATNTFRLSVVQAGMDAGTFSLPAGSHLPGYAGGALQIILLLDGTSVRLKSGAFDSGQLLYTAAGVQGLDSFDDLGTSVAMVLGANADGHGADIIATVNFDSVKLEAGVTPPLQTLLFTDFNANSGGVPAGWTDIGFDSYPQSTVIESGTVVAISDFRPNMGDGGGPQIIQSDFTFNAGGGACAASLSKTSESFTANGGMGSFTVQLAANCDWTAMSDRSFITLTSPSSGSGASNITYTVASHNITDSRSGTITVAGQSFTVVQGPASLDVSPTHPFYVEIGKLAARGITLGCGGGSFCPDAFVTREQMAVLISRALGGFNPPTPAAQRFLDVPTSNQFYAFIEEIAQRQITLGCGGGNYCPTANVTREQMAVFLIRALHTPGYAPALPTMQRFLDVPPGNLFYAHIEELAVRGITLGCGGGNFCPTALVTRAQMAAFLVRAFNL